jgi:hypothetical protein
MLVNWNVNQCKVELRLYLETRLVSSRHFGPLKVPRWSAAPVMIARSIIADITLILRYPDPP